MYNKQKLNVQYNKQTVYNGPQTQNFIYSTTNKLYVMYNKQKHYVQHNKQTVCTVQQTN